MTFEIVEIDEIEDLAKYLDILEYHSDARMVRKMAAENAALTEENERLKARVAELVEALESLVKGYVNLLEAGRDRIASLGGDCDPVPVMEQNDPWLRDAAGWTV